MGRLVTPARGQAFCLSALPSLGSASCSDPTRRPLKHSCVSPCQVSAAVNVPSFKKKTKTSYSNFILNLPIFRAFKFSVKLPSKPFLGGSPSINPKSIITLFPAAVLVEPVFTTDPAGFPMGWDPLSKVNGILTHWWGERSFSHLVESARADDSQIL